jgi:hypothetical protein
LLLAAAGAVLVLVAPSTSPTALAGLGAMLGVGLLTVPAARDPEQAGWWRLLATGAASAGAGVALALLSEGLGGLLSVLGAAAVLTAAVVGMPGRRS